MTSEWLSLLNYSAKYGISLSTLRRRIKNDSINFKQDNGKYYIKDEGGSPQMQALGAESFGDRTDRVNSTSGRADNLKDQSENLKIFSKETLAINQQVPSFVEASVLTSANRLVEELKAAYAKILQEKEEQISQLKEEIGDLRMLVRIMEQQISATTQQKNSDDVFFGDITVKDL